MAFEKEMEQALTDSQAFVIKGATGSGKTWFVEKLVELMETKVVYVPQYPMFKPQLKVSTFIGMLPLPAPARKRLFEDLAAMDVPTDKLIGGKMMGMLDVPGLSGGQRKKLLLALVVQLALTRNARAVVLDEPFAGIDRESMDQALKVLQEVQQFKDLKLFIVTHDHFQLIDDAFVGTPHLKIDSRAVRVNDSKKTTSTLEAARLISRNILATPSKRVEHPPRAPFVDGYVIKRHFIEGEHMLPLFTILTFSVLSGLATGAYKGEGEGIVDFSSIYSFLKVFMLEYIHFGSILNYCFKRGQHKEDYFLLLTRKRDALLETLIIAIIQSTTLAFLLNGILVGMAQRFWWINSSIMLTDAWYGALTQVAYYLLPIIQPNPLICMASIFPYVSVWGFFNGSLLPRSFALKNSRWIAFTSPIYHFSCAQVKVSNGHLKLPGSNCKALALHLPFVSPLLLFAAFILISIYVRNYFRAKKESTLTNGAVPVADVVELDDIEV